MLSGKSSNAPLAEEEVQMESSASSSTSNKVSDANPPSPLSFMRAAWDPLSCPDWDIQKPTPQCVQRIKRDLMTLYKDPPHGIFVVPDDESLTLLHALVIGPYDTPYEGGFFYFCIRCPPDYPIRAPRVRLMTTGDDTVRFNPNLYRNGKICLSILGTWSGPSWSPSQSLSSILISIQSLMNEKPYHNEPGFEREQSAGDSDRYNGIISHETVRVAVCDMLEGVSSAWKKCPESLRDMMRSSFPQFLDHYRATCLRLKDQGLQGMNMADPFKTEKRGKFDPDSLSKRLDSLKETIPLKDQDGARDKDEDQSTDEEGDEQERGE